MDLNADKHGLEPVTGTMTINLRRVAKMETQNLGQPTMPDVEGFM